MRFHNPRISSKSSLGFAVAFFFAVAAIADLSYQEHETKRLTLEREVEALEIEMKHLIENQRKAHGNEEVKIVLDQLSATHKKYSKTLRDYEDLRLHVRFQHPEEADLSERNYRRYSAKSLKDLEGEVGLDGRLDRIKQKVLATFPLPEAAKPETYQPKINPIFRKPASVEGDEEHERIKLVK